MIKNVPKPSFLTALLLLLVTLPAMSIEKPDYKVIEKVDNFELRKYAPMIVAETTVTGDIDDASRRGFKLIADYIFGNNVAQSGDSEKISMTAPVTIEPSSEKISMTAPVTMEQKGEQWRMHFVMPSKYTMTTLPKPKNPAVNLREIPSQHYAAIRFSGFTGEKKVARKTAELRDWMKTKKVEPFGNPELARYNAPWTLPFLRRNEIMIRYQPVLHD